jgi:DnaJ-like protein
MHTPGRSGPPPESREVRRARELLGVTADADASALSRAYRRLARGLHPDLSADPEAPERFRALHTAYQLALDSRRQTTLPAPRPRPVSVDPEPAEPPPGPTGRDAAGWVTLAGSRNDGVWLAAGPVRIHRSAGSGASGTPDRGAR